MGLELTGPPAADSGVLNRLKQCFLVGLFSVLDAMLRHQMQEILETLHLAPEIDDALIHRQGELGAILQCVIAYECRDWDNACNLELEAFRSCLCEGDGVVNTNLERILRCDLKRHSESSGSNPLVRITPGHPTLPPAGWFKQVPGPPLQEFAYPPLKLAPVSCGPRRDKDCVLAGNASDGFGPACIVERL